MTTLTSIENPITGKAANAETTLESVRDRMAVGRALLTLQKAAIEAGSFIEEGKEFHLWNDCLKAHHYAEEGLLPHDAEAPDSIFNLNDLFILAELCGGWWIWDVTPVFITYHQWAEMFTDWQKNILLASQPAKELALQAVGE